MLMRLAFRNLWRNRRRTLLTLSAMVVSSSLLMLSLGVFSGMFDDMLASATEQYHGHLVISKKGYQEDREMFAHFNEANHLTEKLGKMPAVRGVSPRLRAFGLVAHGSNTYPAEFLGVKPHQEQQVTNLGRKLVAGSYLTSDQQGGAVIGSGLAKRLGVKPGDELVFLTQAADGSIGNDLLSVTGIFETGAGNLDNALVLVNLDWLQHLMVLSGKLHELAITLGQPMRAAELAPGFAAVLPESMEALSWGELLPEMQEAIASYDISRLVLVTILYAATGLGILNTVFMSVMERTREFGILMAMGMKPRTVKLMVVMETFAMGLVSLVFGTAAGLTMTLYMQQVGVDLSGYLTAVTYAGGTILPRLGATLVPANIIIPAAALLVLSLVAGYIPARRAARLKPIEAIREE